VTKATGDRTNDIDVAEEVIARREAVQRLALLLGLGLSGVGLEPALTRSVVAARSSGTWTPRALSAQQLEQVATIAEHIIPATDTPGARAVGVPAFVDTMLAEYYTPAEREQLLAGLAAIDARARKAYRRSFLDARAPEQTALLEALDRESLAPRASNEVVANRASRETERGGGGLVSPSGDTSRVGVAAQQDRAPAFFRTMKELTVLGYYTSQPGATKELRYVQVPGRYEGCVPFAKVGRAWAT